MRLHVSEVLIGVNAPPGRYNETFGFDKMGNFNSLTRYENGSLLNNLSFTYTGNQLKKVDNSISPYIPYGSEAFNDRQKIDTEYYYDPNGSTTADVNTGISTIQYNLLNLPNQIQFTEGHKNLYTYNAGGAKLRTVNYTVNNIVNVPIGTISTLPGNPSDYTTLTTDYVGNVIYQNGSLKQITLPEGYWQNGVFYYYLKDHLGDTRVVINSSGTIIEKSHYYPSGMRFADTSTSNSSALPFRYNGKEMETMNGLNQMDYGARRRYSGLPIWTGPDDLREKYYSISPYVYCLNNPIKLVDPDGKDALIWYKDNKGNDQLYRFNGRNKMAPNNQYVLDFIAAYNYDIKNGGGRNLKEAVTNPNFKVYVDDPKDGKDKYISDASQPTVHWKSRQGYKTTKGGHQSAATALEHEMDHAVDDANGPKAHRDRNGEPDEQYDNKEERRVITGSEAETAKANKESINEDHKGTAYKTISPTSTIPSNQ